MPLKAGAGKSVRACLSLRAGQGLKSELKDKVVGWQGVEVLFCHCFANESIRAKQKALLPFVYKGSRAFLIRGDGGI